MAIWPTKFKILRDNFKEKPKSRVIRSNMDIGPAKVRRRTVLTETNVTFSMALSLADYEEFMDFYYDNDVLTFDFTRPDNNQSIIARFVGAPEASLNQTMWAVSVELELLP